MRWRRRSQEVDCGEVRRVVQRYLDGDLDPSRTLAARAHLKDCARCGMDVRVYRRILRSLRRHRGELDPASVERIRAFAEDLATGTEP